MSSSPGLGARPGGPRVAVKMEAATAGAPFYSDEGLELLPDFVFNAEGGPQVEEGSKMLLGASSKKGPFSSSSSSSSSMRPRGGLQHRLLPTESPLSGSGAEVSPSSGVVLLQPPLLKLPPASDLEQLLIQAGSPSSTSPTAPTAGAPFLYRTPAAPSAAAASATASSGASAVGVTQEQEGFADGFVKALADLHKQNQLLGVPPPPPPPAPLSPTQPPHPCCPPARQPEPPAIYTTLGGYNPGSPSSGGGAFYGRALEEPQTVPETVPGVGVVVGVSVAPPPPTLSSGESPPPQPPPSSSSLSPLDAESQERLKAERKRLRNRIAASKCRRRKLERIARLEEKVKALKGQNAELAATASLLRAQVTQLQGRVRSHLSSGCHINAAAPAPSSSSSSSQTSGVVGVQPQGPPEPESSTC